MGKLYDSWRGAGKVTLDCNLLTGSYEDRSLYKNEVTAQGTPQWSAGPQGWGVGFKEPASRLVCAHNPALNVSDGWLFVQLQTATSIRNIVEKGTSELVFATWSANQLYAGPPGGRTGTYSGKRNSFIGLRISASGSRELFDNGVFLPLHFSSAWTPAYSTGVYGIGNATAGGYAHEPPIWRVLLINSPMSNAQVQDLYAELLEERYPTTVYSFQKPSIKQIGSPVLHWPLTERDASGQYPDISGNGRGTALSRVCSEESGLVRARENSLASITRNTLIQECIPSAADFTMTYTLKMENSTTRTLVFSNALVNVYNAVEGSYIWARVGNEGVTMNAPAAVKANRTHRIAWVKNGAVQSVYSNGKLINSGAAGNTPASATQFGFMGFSDGPWTSGAFGNFRVFNSALSEQDIRKIYLEGSRVTCHIDIDNIPVYVDTTGSGFREYIKNAPELYVGQGLWSQAAPKALRVGSSSSSLVLPVKQYNGTIYATISSYTTSLPNVGERAGIGWGANTWAPTSTLQTGYFLYAKNGVLTIGKAVSGAFTELATGGWIEPSEITSGIQILPDGDMEKVGTGDYASYNTSTLTKETTTPYAGTRCLRVTKASALGGATCNGVCVIGKAYRLRGWARSGGSSASWSLLQTSFNELGFGTSTNWEYFDVCFVAKATSIILGKNTAGTYVEYDSVVLEEITGDKNIKYDLMFAWETDDTLTAWYRKHGSPRWEFACKAKDTSSPVTTANQPLLFSNGYCKYHHEISVDEIAITPNDWGLGEVEAPTVLYKFDADDYATTGVVTSGLVGDTGWTVAEAGYRIAEYSGEKWLEATEWTSVASRSFNMQIYGTIVFKVANMKGSSGEMNIYFADSLGILPNNAIHIQLNNPSNALGMYKRVGGVSTTVYYSAGKTAPIGVPYWICLTRDRNGKGNLYLKGGGYPNWTLVSAHTITDAVFSSSLVYVTVSSYWDAMRWTNMYLLNEVIDPTVSPELIPA